MHSITTKALLIFFFCSFQQAVAETYSASFLKPDFDRWMYPYNVTPGSRQVGPTFGAVGEEEFDERDGQNLFSFISVDAIPSDMGPDNYIVTAAILEVTLSNSEIVYDSTQDSWESYDPSTGVTDVDIGRPMELFGTGFRNDYDAWNFGEDGAYGSFAKRARNAYAISYSNIGEKIDVSNNVVEQFNPLFFAIGKNESLADGQPMDSETVLTFDIDVSNPNIQNYIQESLNDGIVSFVLTSLHGATQPGVRGSNVYPNFHLKESIFVELGLADAAQLSLVVEINDNSVPEDIDGDGVVDINDLLLLISAWGSCDACEADINVDGAVDVQDLLSLIAPWSI